MDHIQKIKNALSDAYVGRIRAENAFEQAEKEIERINAQEINIYLDDVRGKIVEAVYTAMDASFTLYKTCQQLVLDLHETCVPLVTEDTPTRLIEELAHEIEKLNENCEINQDHTGTLDGIAFDRSICVQFRPTEQAKEIEKFWNDLAAKRRRRDPKPVVAPKPTQPKPAPAAQPDVALLEQQKKHAEAIQEDCHAKVAAYKTALSQEVERLMEAFQAATADRLKSAQEEKAALEKTLSSLGLFAFGEKKATKAAIAQLESTLAALQDPEAVKAERKRLTALSTKAAKQYAKQVDAYLYQRFPSLAPDRIQYCYPHGREGDYLRVLNGMQLKKTYSLEEVHSLFPDFSSSYIRMLLKNLHDDGYVRCGAAKGCTTYTVTTKGKEQLTDLKIDLISYAECAAAAALPCPEAPCAADAFR